MSEATLRAAHVVLVVLLGCQPGSDARLAPSSPPLRAASTGSVLSVDQRPALDVPREAAETGSGLRSVILRSGSGGAGAELHDGVTIVYAAWTPDGEPLARLTTSGRPRRLAMRDLFFGLAEGIGLMREGERRRLWIPAPLVLNGSLAASRQDMVIDVDLIEIHRGEKLPEVPADLAPPPDAARTESGLAYRILEPGTGSRHPAPPDRVRVQYSAWTPEGVMFRTTYGRGSSTVPVSGLIAGWSEGVQLMVEGERRRLWIPEVLAYRGQHGQPRGMLVYDVWLIEILPAVPTPAEAR